MLSGFDWTNTTLDVLLESRIKKSGAGLRMDRIPAVDLWDLAIDVLHFAPHRTRSTGKLVAEQTHCEIHSDGRTKKLSNKSEDFGLK